MARKARGGEWYADTPQADLRRMEDLVARARALYEQALMLEPRLQPALFVKTYPQHKKDIIDLLVGDVFRPEVGEVFEPMKSMAPIPDAIPLEKPGHPDDKVTRRQGDKEMAEDGTGVETGAGAPMSS